MTQITLKQGDWTQSPLTEQEYYNVCIAFIRAGAEYGEAFDYDEFSKIEIIGWDSSDEVYHPIMKPYRVFERELTYEQIINATNSGFSDFAENLRNESIEMHKEKLGNEDQDENNNPQNKKCECGKYSHMTGGNHMTDCHNSPDNKKSDNPNCNREYLPQSGERCEYITEKEKEYRDCKIIYVGKKYVLVSTDAVEEVSLDISKTTFRESKAEMYVKEMTEKLGNLSGIEFAELLARHLYHNKIPFNMNFMDGN